jgi:glyoxylase-like metal-dependent hydrolase (beta-lactamase superfamily II)
MMLIRRILFLITLLFMAGSLFINTAAAAPPKQAPEGQEYIIQAGDTLSILADRFLGDTSAFQQIVEATNAKAGEDSSFAIINDPGLIEVGQKVWIPTTEAGGQAPAYQLVEVGNGIYSFGNGFIYSGIVVTDEGVIVLDPMNSQHAELTLEAIRGITEQPLRYVIYSHNHWDHVGGGQVFKDAGATIISHVAARDWLLEHPNPDVAVPDEVWEGNRHDIQLGDKTVELYFFGPNHGEGMTVTRFAEDRIVFIADLVVPNRVGFGNLPDFFPAEWERTLTEIEALDFDTAMFTHGEPFGLPSTVTQQKEYLQDLRNAIFAEFQKGTPPLAIPNSIELPKYEEWDGYNDWLSLNAWRLLMEIFIGW